jgi:hypothetical protein
VNKEVADFLKEARREMLRHSKVLGGYTDGTAPSPIRCSCGELLFTGNDSYIGASLHAEHREEVWLDLIRDFAVYAYNKGYRQAMDDHYATGFYDEDKRANPFEKED